MKLRFIIDENIKIIDDLILNDDLIGIDHDPISSMPLGVEMTLPDHSPRMSYLLPKAGPLDSSHSSLVKIEHEASIWPSISN